MNILSDVEIRGVASFFGDVDVESSLRFRRYGSPQVGLFAGMWPRSLEIRYDATVKTILADGDIETNADAKLSPSATQGFLRIGRCEGVPTGVPRSIGGFGTPVVFDSVGDKLYVYNSGWKPFSAGTGSVGAAPNYLPKWNSSGTGFEKSVITEAYGMVFVGGELIPGSHAVPGDPSKLGNISHPWDQLHVTEAYLPYTSAPSLATDDKGKIIVGSTGGGSGSDLTGGGTGNTFAMWSGPSNHLTNAKMVDTAYDIAVMGRHFRQSSSGGKTLGTLAIPWSGLFSDWVKLTDLKSEPLLGTDQFGQIVKGTVPAATTSKLGGIVVGQNLSVSGSGVLGATLPAHPVSGHSDVLYPSPPADNQMLGWNAASSRWENRTVPLKAHTLESHTNVNIAGPVTVGQVLTYVGGGERWKNVTPASSTYTLPVATTAVLGGVKQGYGITIATDGRIAADPYTLPVATSTRLGGVKKGTNVTIDANGVISAVGHQWGRRHAKWSSTSGDLLVTTGAYAEWPAMTQDYGYLLGFASNTFTIETNGLYTFSVNGTVDNMGDGSSHAMDDLRISFLVTKSTGGTDYESIFVSNTGVQHFTNTFSVDRSFSLVAGDTVKLRYRFKVGRGTPSIYSLNASATQVA